jgi:hypothetical protein
MPDGAQTFKNSSTDSTNMTAPPTGTSTGWAKNGSGCSATGTPGVTKRVLEKEPAGAGELRDLEVTAVQLFDESRRVRVLNDHHQQFHARILTPAHEL